MNKNKRQLTKVQLEAKSRRNRSRRANRKANVESQLYENKSRLGNMATSYMGANRSVFKPSRGSLSPAGMAFLKCAFAPVDFADTMVTGVPDGQTGNILLSKNRYIGAFSLPPLTDRVLILTGIPGYACMYKDGVNGFDVAPLDVFFPIPYPEARGLLSGSNTGTYISGINVSSFRMVSNHLEIINTSAIMNTAGSIQIYKSPLTYGDKASFLAGGNLKKTLHGLEGANSTAYRGFDGHLLSGAYTAAYSNGKFEWTPVIEGQQTIPQTVENDDFGQFVFNVGNGFGFPGMDNSMNTTFIRISNTSTNAQSYRLKTFQCVEYLTNPKSMMYPYSGNPPLHDALAMEIYKKLIGELPIAVVYADNANFWERCLQIIKRITSGLSYIPGPYGAMAAGVNGVATALEQLTL